MSALQDARLSNRSNVKFSTIFLGVIPFIVPFLVTDLIRLVILIAFPIIALWLPSRM